MLKHRTRIAMGLAGIVCLVVGAAMVFAPAGWLVAGAGLLFVAIDSKPPRR